ncbi:hypothetical protein AeRB84_008363, partial [Aphanomyces euteiches]
MFLYEHLSDAVFCVENNNYSASKKGKSNNNRDNDNQGHAIDNSEPGKQEERNAVQESTSTGAYGMAVDDDALNKGNINDEVAMRKTKKAEYNKRAREKKRQAILDKANEELASRKKGGKRMIGRMLTVSPRSGDCFYMRMLLCYRRGPTSHEDLRTVNGVVHPKFKSAALALGFLENDEEWLTCMREATETATPYELRTLFV